MLLFKCNSAEECLSVTLEQSDQRTSSEKTNGHCERFSRQGTTTANSDAKNGGQPGERFSPAKDLPIQIMNYHGGSDCVSSHTEVSYILAVFSCIQRILLLLAATSDSGGPNNVFGDFSNRKKRKSNKIILNSLSFLYLHRHEIDGRIRN